VGRRECNSISHPPFVFIDEAQIGRAKRNWKTLNGSTFSLRPAALPSSGPVRLAFQWVGAGFSITVLYIHNIYIIYIHATLWPKSACFAPALLLLPPTVFSAYCCACAAAALFSAVHYTQCLWMSPQHLVPQVARCLQQTGQAPRGLIPLREASSKTGHRGPREDLYTRASRPAGHLKRKQAKSPLREVTRVSRPEARSAMLHHSCDTVLESFREL
jgi:hypothetical protein